MRRILIMVAAVIHGIAIFSCGNRVDQPVAEKKISVTDTTDKIKQDTTKAGISGGDTTNNRGNDSLKNRFPTIGSKATDFLPADSSFTIQYRAKGDLNNDRLPDQVLVLANKNTSIPERPMLVLLKNAGGGYRLDKVSTMVMPVIEVTSDPKPDMFETIEVKDNKLQVNISSSFGNSGSILSHFKYDGPDLKLIHVESFSAGAGSWLTLYYDLKKEELTEETTNTMKEDMPTVTKKAKVKPASILFEDSSPDEIIADAYNRSKFRD